MPTRRTTQVIGVFVFAFFLGAIYWGVFLRGPDGSSSGVTPSSASSPSHGGSSPPNTGLSPGDVHSPVIEVSSNPIEKLLKNGRPVAEGQIAVMDATGKKQSRRVEIYKTDMKYPMIRVERSGDGKLIAAMVADHVLVEPRGGVSEKAFSEFVAKSGLRVVKHLHGSPGYLVAGPPAGISTLEGLQKRMKEGAGAVITDIAEPDYVVTVQAVPNDPLFGKLWGLHNLGGTGGKIDSDIDAPEAWDISHNASSIVVGVIDTGIDYTHPDLAANIWVNTAEIAGNSIDDDGNGLVDDVNGYDFYNEDGNPMDDHFHGTHVAGTIAAKGNNGVGAAGVAWSAKLIAIKFLSASGSGFVSDAIQSINYATAKGARLTSNSWGGAGYSSALRAAIQDAGTAGVLFVAAAGNDGLNSDVYPHYPSAFDLPEIISVAATDSSDVLAYFSNYGLASVDVAAPGVAILSTVPGANYGTVRGTSMATPHVSGACALLLAQNPALTPAQVKLHIKNTADPLPSLKGKTVSGGRLNLNALLHGLVSQAPVISSPNQATAYIGQSFTFTVTATNTPSRFDAAGLPSGFSIDRGTGVISGVAAAGGVYPVALSASNVSGTGSATLMITVVAPPPVITSATIASGVLREFFYYQIGATNDPASFGAAGLPAGLSVNVQSGLISGYPTQSGIYSVQISATNTGGTGTASLNLQINLPGVPVIGGVLEATGTLGQAFSYQITASNRPISYQASGLPSGISVNPATGLISGTPTQVGIFTVTLGAQNEGGLGTAVFSLVINLPAAPVVTSPPTLTARVDQASSYQITATNAPGSLGASGLPAGLSVSSSGLVSGTPTQAGSYEAVIFATNAGGTGKAALAITVLPNPPAITSIRSIQATVGHAVSYQITATNQPATYGATDLLPGLLVDTQSGIITGSVSTVGAYQIVISAGNAGGIGSATLTLNIVPEAPVISSPVEVTVEAGAPVTYSITASNLPTSYSASNLPGGLTLNSGTGEISGEVSIVGNYSIGISATNSGGTGVSTLVLHVNEGPTRILSFSPAEISPGDSINIQGLGFTGATNVYFSDRTNRLVPATNFTVISDTQISAAVPYLTQANEMDYSWIIVISPKGLAVALPPSTIDVFNGYNLGGSGSRYAIVHPGGALISSGGGGHSVVVESGASANLNGGGGHFFFVDGGGTVDISTVASSATIFHAPTALLLNQASISGTSTTAGFYEVPAVRATVMEQLLRSGRFQKSQAQSRIPWSSGRLTFIR